MRYDIPQSKVGFASSVVFMSQGPATELDFGAALRYKPAQGTKFTGFLTESAISGGLLYRMKDAIIPQLFF